MELCAIDLEVFWSDEHSITKMEPDVYAMHQKTQIISCAFAYDNGDSDITFGEDKTREYIEERDWSKTLAVGHNMAEFDALFLAWRLGLRPALWSDTLAMARRAFSINPGLSLAKLVEHYRIGKKDRSALYATKGKRLEDFSKDEISAMTKYNIADTEQCLALFKTLMRKGMSSKVELIIIDQRIRMLVEPQLLLDEDLLRSTLRGEIAEQEKAYEAFADWIDDGSSEHEIEAYLNDGDKFASFLKQKYGVEPPMKPKPGDPNKKVYAFAKTDKAYWKAAEEVNPLVETARKLKLERGGTADQARIERMLQANDLCPFAGFPIPVRYAEGVNWQDAGFGGYNMLNMPNINGSPSDAIRNSLIAPEGYSLVKFDMTGMQLRINHILWKVVESMNLFKDDPAGADLYVAFAAYLYKRQKNEINDKQRSLGKMAQLSLGFGAGGGSLLGKAKKDGIALDWEQCNRIVSRWRQTYSNIVDGWKRCDNALSNMVVGECDIELDPWGLCKAGPYGIETPGSFIYYPNLRAQKNKEGKTEYVYDKRDPVSRKIVQDTLYGAKMNQHLNSHLQRQYMVTCALKIKAKLGANPALSVFDDGLYVVQDGLLDHFVIELADITRTPPKWWPDLTVWSSISVGKRFGDLKEMSV